MRVLDSLLWWYFGRSACLFIWPKISVCCWRIVRIIFNFKKWSAKISICSDCLQSGDLDVYCLKCLKRLKSWIWTKCCFFSKLSPKGAPDHNELLFPKILSVHLETSSCHYRSTQKIECSSFLWPASSEYTTSQSLMHFCYTRIGCPHYFHLLMLLVQLCVLMCSEV